MRQYRLSLFLTALGQCIGVEAFSVVPQRLGHKLVGHHVPIPSPPRHATSAAASTTTLLWLSSAPSDSATEEQEFAGYGSSRTVVAVEGQDYNGTPGEELVNSVLDLMPSDSAFTTVSPEQRAAINEALYKLEALNPTDSPAASPLLNGVWSLRYSGGYTSEFALPSPTRQLALFLYDGGYSPGMFTYTLAQSLPKQLVDTEDLEITIQRSNPRVTASIRVRLLGGVVDGTVAVQARLDTESGMRLRETYESASILGQPARDFPGILQYARELYVTYLDDDLLIVRDGSGVPEVLVRKDKSFSKQWGTEPSSVMDLTPPGDGDDAKF